MANNVYAPMLIPTMSRDEHFIKCIESLKKNTWAQFTDVYIGLDYPPSEKYMEGYQKICEYLQNSDFSSFASFNVIKQENNAGSFKNMQILREAVDKSYPFFIRTDDDTEFSINFLEYMNKTLWKYMDDEDVLGVTGYSYPIKWKVKEGSNTFKMNFACPMWGTAFYSERFLKLRTSLLDDYYEKNAENIVKHRKYRKLSDARFVDFAGECLQKGYGLTKIMTDIGVGTYMPLEGKWCMISPTNSKVRNLGFDGSGEYCPRITGSGETNLTADKYNYSRQEIDESAGFEVIPDDSTDYDTNRKLLNGFDKRKAKTLLKAKVKIMLFALLGKERYRRIIAKR